MNPPLGALSPHGDPAEWLEAWARSADLVRVVGAFHGETAAYSDLSEWLAYLEDFSARWDFRGGQERNLVEAPEFSDELTDLILTASAALGMRGTTEPAQQHYQHVVILGGLVRACLARPRHAADLLRTGRVTAERVIALGGFRPLRGDEKTLVNDLLDTSVTDEYHAMRAGMEAAFGLEGPNDTRGEISDVVGVSWGVSDYDTKTGPSAHVVAAPSSEPGVRRANTPDTYEWLAAKSTWLHRDDAVLLVTTGIYAPYQGADAIRMLAVPHGIKVDVVGIEPGGVDPRLAQPFAAHNYLQEMRSTIRSLRMLHNLLTS